jgi:hypothetical protein
VRESRRCIVSEVNVEDGGKVRFPGKEVICYSVAETLKFMAGDIGAAVTMIDILVSCSAAKIQVVSYRT